jgi:hypothetical protein
MVNAESRSFLKSVLGGPWGHRRRLTGKNAQFITANVFAEKVAVTDKVTSF